LHELIVCKTILSDKNDEALDQLRKDLEAVKLKMNTSINHIILNESLQESFKKIDEFELEYRRYYDENIKIIEKHP